MVALNEALLELVKAKTVAPEEAMAKAVDKPASSDAEGAALWTHVHDRERRVRRRRASRLTSRVMRSI